VGWRVSTEGMPATEYSDAALFGQMHPVPRCGYTAWPIAFRSLLVRQRGGRVEAGGLQGVVADRDKRDNAC
jgi:hypothetical protein